MNLTELLLVFAVVALLAAGGLALERWQRESALGRDLVRVQDVAQQYAASRCASPPGTAVALDGGLADLGLASLPIEHHDRWAIAVTARPGRMGTAAAIQYAAAVTDWRVAYLAKQPGAVRTATGVSLALARSRQPAANQRGFQLLLEDQLC